MRFAFLLLTAIALLASPAAFAESGDHTHEGQAETPPPAPVEPGPFQAVVNVNGIVCSFCAVGANKALAEIPGLDAERFTKGVHVDIENQKLTLAFQPGAPIPVSEIREAIRSAGYDPVSMHIELSGWEAAE